MRPSMVDVAMKVAMAHAERSEDQWNKVGAVALTGDNRIIACAYNGLLPGYELGHLWEYLGAPARDERLPFMVHAEQNLCSLIKRGEANQVVTTLCPCPSCLLLLAVHGIKSVVYLRDYERYNATISRVAEFYNIQLTKYEPKKG